MENTEYPKMMYPTSFTKLLNQNDVEFRFKDNEIAHGIINDIIKKLIERLNKLEEELVNQSKDINERFNRLETFVTTQLVGADSLQYRPFDHKDYISLGKTLDDIYNRLNKIENTTM
jgi:hypothetical protein